MQIIRLGLQIPLFRNLVGRFKTTQGLWVNAGLGKGSSDLIGWTPTIVTMDMVGDTVAVFTAIEVKVPGAYTKPTRLAEQESFIAAVRRDGGFAGFADSVDQAKEIIRG